MQGVKESEEPKMKLKLWACSTRQTQGLLTDMEWMKGEQSLGGVMRHAELM